MDAKTYVKKQIASVRRIADGVLQGLSDEQVNWAPPGTGERHRRHPGPHADL